MKIRYVNEKTAVLIYTPINRRYLTGFNSSLGYLLLMKDENILFVDGRYYEAALKCANNCRVEPIKNICNQLNEFASKKGFNKILIEIENEISFLSVLRKNLSVVVKPSESLSRRLLEMRSVKTKEEINSIVEAQRIAEKAFCDALDFIKTGVTEREIAAFLEYRMKSYGSESAAFETIVVSGENSSLPHGVPSERRIKDGDFITMDFGARVNGYCSDMTRTVAVDFVTDEMRDIYDTVLKAQDRVEKAVIAGLKCSDADNAARRTISEAGYAEYFNHSTGHGIGLEVHEIPNLSPKSENVLLRKGQIVSNEPGIYIPGKFGVRIEDMLLITKSGCKNLTKAEKHLIIL